MTKIIFDLDDTLYQNSKLRNSREQAILKFLGEKKSQYIELRKTKGTIKSLEILGISREKFNEIVSSVPISLQKNLKLIKILSELKKEHKLIILSNNSNYIIKKTISQLGINNLVDEYHGTDDFSSIKPSHEFFSLVKKEDIVIGNNFKKDLAIPKEKEAITILISKENNQLADYTIPSIYQLLTIIKKIKSRQLNIL